VGPHPPLRLRVLLAVTLLVVAGTLVGAAVLLGTNQDDPATIEAAAIAPTGPPLGVTDGIMANPEAAETADPGLHLRVLDKDAAIAEQRAERAAAREAAAAEAAQTAAILEFAAALAESEAAPAPEPAPAPAPAPAIDPAPAPTSAPAPAGGGGAGLSMSEKLDRIAQCESGGNPRAYNPQGPWFGAWQFSRPTWNRMGGGPRDIRSYSYAQQKVVAERLVRSDGWDSWPSCSAQLGYT
jgi:hypothetical protein